MADASGRDECIEGYEDRNVEIHTQARFAEVVLSTLRSTTALVLDRCYGVAGGGDDLVVGFLSAGLSDGRQLPDHLRARASGHSGAERLRRHGAGLRGVPGVEDQAC